MQSLKVHKIDDSLVITLSPEILQKLQVKEGDSILAIETNNGIELVVRGSCDNDAIGNWFRRPRFDRPLARNEIAKNRDFIIRPWLKDRKKFLKSVGDVRRWVRLRLEPHIRLVGMISFVLPDVFTLIIEIESTRSDRVNESKRIIKFPLLMWSMGFSMCGGRTEKIHQFMRSG